MTKAFIVVATCCISAPSAPMDVHVTSNVTDCITVQWSSPLMVVHQVDRYYVRYEAVDEPLDQGERLIEDVNNSYDVYEVSSFFIMHIVFQYSL